MQPNNKRSIDGVRRQKPTPKIQPDYRPDHELPTPKPTPKLPKHDTLSLPALVKPRGKRKRVLAIVAVIVIILATILGAIYAWYQQNLSPVSTDTAKRVRVMIVSGASPADIGRTLEQQGVIRSQAAFSFYVKISGTENKLRAGAYSLQPSLSTPAIVDHLVSGKADTFTVTFLPGDTLANSRSLLIGLGYSAQDVDSALGKSYDNPVLFSGKPDGTDLEGYLYGETIEFDYSASVETILEKFFSQYENFVTENNLVAAFKKQGLTLYQGITLASIVQREVRSEDMPAVARVFLNRLKAGMTLGSDVTYQYAAKKLGVDPTPDLDSPYNTRKYPGLPPGPIATPGNSALLAIAHPAKNDYLFFLSGDDDKTYFSKTDEGHQQNIVQHCQKKCQIL